MAFFEKGKSVPVDPKFLSYTYPETTLFNSGQWQKKNLTHYTAEPYYKITYPIGTGSNAAKLVYSKQGGVPAVYTPTYMYIFSLLHNNISGITSSIDKENSIVGELVIEHKNNNNDNKLFLCILLKGYTADFDGTPSSIDNILQMIFSDPTVTDTFDKRHYLTSCELAFDKKDIKTNQNCFIYNDTIHPNNTVIILTEPILLGNKNYSNLISKFEKNTDLFSISAPTNYESETSGAITNAPAETSDNVVLGKRIDDEIYIDCQPTGPSLEDIATYNIPIGSALSQDMQKLDFMKTSVNFFLFCLGLILIYMGVPVLYKMLVIDKTIENVPDKEERLKTIRSADVLIMIGFAIVIFSSFYYGFKEDGDMTLITTGLFGFVILGISISLIMVKKLDLDFTTHKTEVVDTRIVNPQTEADSKTIISILSGIFVYMFSVKGSLVHILVCDVIALSILGALVGTGTIDQPTFEKYCFRTLLIYIPVWVTLFIFLSSSGGPSGIGAGALGGLMTGMA
jgi:uncharacterized membrane protein YccF (DUF307 family)